MKPKFAQDSARATRRSSFCEWGCHSWLWTQPDTLTFLFSFAQLLSLLLDLYSHLKLSWHHLKVVTLASSCKRWKAQLPVLLTRTSLGPLWTQDTVHLKRKRSMNVSSSLHSLSNEPTKSSRKRVADQPGKKTNHDCPSLNKTEEWKQRVSLGNYVETTPFLAHTWEGPIKHFEIELPRLWAVFKVSRPGWSWIQLSSHSKLGMWWAEDGDSRLSNSSVLWISNSWNSSQSVASQPSRETDGDNWRLFPLSPLESLSGQAVSLL